MGYRRHPIREEAPSIRKTPPTLAELRDVVDRIHRLDPEILREFSERLDKVLERPPPRRPR